MTVEAYRFTITCPQCGGTVRQVNGIRQSAVSQVVILECTTPRCGKQHELSLQLYNHRR